MRREELSDDFIRSMQSLLGDVGSCRLIEAMSTESPVSIRLNPWKTCREEAAGLERVAWSDLGFYLPTRPSFTRDPLFHAGCYYVQEASSMFIEQAVRRYLSDRPLTVLDLCAAPGGKSTHLRSLLPEGSLLVCNEVVPNRAAVLAENMVKWGHPDVIVTRNEPKDFSHLTGLFDAVVVDAPCSGEGMFRKEPVAVSDWSLQAVEMCAERGRQILDAIWPALKVGGIMIYSTCTYNLRENEDNVSYLCEELGAEPLTIEDEGEAVGSGRLRLPGSRLPVYRFFPHRVRGEGFSLAVVRKTASMESAKTYEERSKDVRRKELIRTKKNEKHQGKSRETSGGDLPILKTWMRTSDDYLLLPQAGGEVSAFPRRHLPTLSRLEGLHILLAGTGVASLKGKEYAPLHSLAMSRLIRREAFENVELDYNQSISYLRGEVVSLPDSTRRGTVLLTYQGTPIGFARNVGRRANNLYPTSWRIRSTYTATGQVQVLRRR